MTSKADSAVARHRAGVARRGFVRVEVNVRREDVGLVRSVALALSDPGLEEDARRFLHQRFSSPPPVDLKALLAAAPLEGIDLDRSRDTGRDVDL